jgi:hypothetical protein
MARLTWSLVVALLWPTVVVADDAVPPAPDSEVVGGSAPAPAPSPSPSPSPTATATAAPSPLGTWRFVGGERERKAQAAAIEEIVAELNMLIRGVARGRLTETNPIAPQIELAADGDKTRFWRLAFETRATPDGRKWPGKGREGKDITVQQWVQGATFRELITAADGSRETVMTVRGDTLKLVATVRSPQLPRALRYELSYQRGPP